MAIMPAWNQREMYYFIETCGGTGTNQDIHVSNCNDYFGNTNYEEMRQLKIFYFLHECLPIVDGTLMLERKWATGNLFRLLTTVLRFCIVSMRYQHMHAKIKRSKNRIIKSLFNIEVDMK